MPYPAWRPGMRLTAARLLAGSNWDVIYQANNQLVTNSTTLANSDLVIPVEASARYKFELLASYRAPTANGFAAAWSVPSGTTMLRWVTGPGSGNTSTTRQSLDRVNLEIPATAAAASAVGGTGSGDSVGYHERGVIETGSVAGSCIFQFAQRVAAASTSAELRGTFSHVTWIRIG